MTSLPTSTPHPAAVEVRRWALDSYHGLRHLRAALREAIADAPVDDLEDVFERMAVVATELATNALRHGLPPTVVRLLREDRRLIIDVADHDLSAEPSIAYDRPAERGGLGLRLTRSFAVEVGWYKAEDTKHVWASFPG